MGDGLDDFSGSLLMSEEAADNMGSLRMHALRRGRLLTDDVELQQMEEGPPAPGEAGGSGVTDAGEEDGEEGSEEGSGIAPLQRGVRSNGAFCQRGSLSPASQLPSMHPSLAG